MMKTKMRAASKKQEAREYGKVLGSSLSFDAAEAYRLLRTNLSFSLPDENGCKIIGVTSTLRGEGKSTTAVNLAYTMAQTGQRVLLLEADLRLPTAAKRMKLKAAPGLSNLLAGQCAGTDVLQRSDMIRQLRVICAGDIPPNPAELLNSEQMAESIRVLSEAFDVIIMDLPPVSVVSDALIVSRLLSGMIVVVREGMCSKKDLNETIRQLKFTECKLLGFVMTDAGYRDKRYGSYRKKSYSYGRKNYSYGYGSSRTQRPERPAEDVKND